MLANYLPYLRLLESESNASKNELYDELDNNVVNVGKITGKDIQSDQEEHHVQPSFIFQEKVHPAVEQRPSRLSVHHVFFFFRFSFVR